MAVVTNEVVQTGVSLKDMIARAVFEVVASFEAVASAVADYRARRNTSAQLNALSDTMLADIGLTRSDIDRVVSSK